MRIITTIIFSIVLILSCKETVKIKNYFIPVDHHVHILSPQLVKDWKALGVPFSKPDSAYTSISYILNQTKAQKMYLLSMAYLYGSEDLSSENEYEKVKYENDYVNEQAKKFPNKCFPFFSINPLKDYAKKEIIRCIDSLNMSGLKLHLNNSGVSLRIAEHRAELNSVMKMAVERNTPVILHLHNGEDYFGKEDAAIFIDSILTDLPGIELYIAHLGSSGGYNSKSEEVLDEFIKYFKDNEDYLNQKIYFDISAVLLTEDVENIPALSDDDINKLSPKIKEVGLNRIVLGSDYPVFNTLEYVNVLKEKLKISEDEFEKLINNSGAIIKSNSYNKL